MRAGLVPLVTETTGTRSEARAIDPSLVVAPDTASIADGVCTYFDRSPDERRTLSEQARSRGEQFDPESRKAAFREAYRNVLKALYSAGSDHSV
jgi:glycosyltransferase involved in cell wall biosynthesis